MSEPEHPVSPQVRTSTQDDVTIRPLAESDRDRLLAFGAALPVNDVIYLEDDYHNIEIITRFVNASHAENWRQVVAIAKDAIVGYAAVRRLPGWSNHVGAIRLIIRPDWRRTGLGTLLAQTICDAAHDLEVDKVMVEMLATQTSGRAIFERLGFQVEGMLSDHARDRQGKRHNLLILAQHLHT